VLLAQALASDKLPKTLSKELHVRREIGRPVGYLELLRSNRGFRFLWLGQVVSQMGDWFDTVAVYTIALKLTGSSRSVALIMVARFLPTVVLSPLAGVIADRFSRRWIMISSDIFRRSWCSVFIYPPAGSDVVGLCLNGLSVGVSSFFEPQRPLPFRRLFLIVNLCR
jgi:MFS family permease